MHLVEILVRTGRRAKSSVHVRSNPVSTLAHMPNYALSPDPRPTRKPNFGPVDPRVLKYIQARLRLIFVFRAILTVPVPKQARVPMFWV